jgi:hypothetical protein
VTSDLVILDLVIDWRLEIGGFSLGISGLQIGGLESRIGTCNPSIDQSESLARESAINHQTRTHQIANVSYGQKI